MMNKLKLSAMPIITAFCAAFVIIFLSTFDSYALTNLTPETPFLKIADIPFHRIEFIVLLFSLTFTVGAVIGVLLKKRIRILLPISAAIIGIIALIIGILDIDVMQKIIPMTRISHVIMTVSRLTGIILGISGLFVGILSCAMIKHGKYILSGIVVGAAISIFAEAANIYNVIYMSLGILIIIVAVLLQYVKHDQLVTYTPQQTTNINISTKIIHYGNAFLTAGAAILIAIVGYIYFKFTLDTPTAIYTITIAAALAIYIVTYKLRVNNTTKLCLGVLCLIIWIAAIVIPDATLTALAIISSAMLLGACRSNSSAINSKYTIIAASAGCTVFAIIAVALNHCLAEIIKHSGNRVIYQVSEYAWIVLLAILAIILIKSIFVNRKSAVEQTPTMTNIIDK